MLGQRHEQRPVLAAKGYFDGELGENRRSNRLLQARTAVEPDRVDTHLLRCCLLCKAQNVQQCLVMVHKWPVPGPTLGRWPLWQCFHILQQKRVRQRPKLHHNGQEQPQGGAKNKVEGVFRTDHICLGYVPENDSLAQ